VSRAAVGNQAGAEGGTIGLLVGKAGATMTDSRVIMTGRQAIAFDVAVGVLFVVGSESRRNWPRVRPENAQKTRNYTFNGVCKQLTCCLYRHYLQSEK
jgi:hypothetical protein